MTISSAKKLVFAGLLALIAGSALVFWKKSAPGDAASAGATDGLGREVLARRLPPLRGAGAAHVLQPHEESAFKVPTASTSGIVESRGSEFSANYHRSFNPAAALMDPLDDSDSSGPELGTPSGTPRLSTHVVVDGDTLSKLAARYLGSSDRYLEIFEANRKVLSKPDLLPIGAVLELPPLERAAPGVSAADEQPAGRNDLPVETSSDGESDDLPLVPVPKGALERSAK